MDFFTFFSGLFEIFDQLHVTVIAPAPIELLPGILMSLVDSSDTGPLILDDFRSVRADTHESIIADIDGNMTGACSMPLGIIEIDISSDRNILHRMRDDMLPRISHGGGGTVPCRHPVMPRSQRQTSDTFCRISFYSSSWF